MAQKHKIWTKLEKIEKKNKQKGKMFPCPKIKVLRSFGQQLDRIVKSMPGLKFFLSRYLEDSEVVWWGLEMLLLPVAAPESLVGGFFSINVRLIAGSNLSNAEFVFSWSLSESSDNAEMPILPGRVVGLVTEIKEVLTLEFMSRKYA